MDMRYNNFMCCKEDTNVVVLLDPFPFAVDHMARLFDKKNHGNSHFLI